MTRPGLGALLLAISTFLLLLGLPQAHEIADASSTLARRRDAALQTEPPVRDTAAAPETRFSRQDVGTKDAPVDGMDGKPHAGPFVDSSDSSKRSSGATRQLVPEEKHVTSRDKAEAEDGVMNDSNRLPPKKGTTGTEGGVSEKDRDRRIHEFSTGGRMAKTPDQPKASRAEPDGDATASSSTVAGRATAVSRDVGDSDSFIGLEV